ncbi:MAG: 5-bromo-4-chloroindolyl phosphate hydrolysis family protein [Bacilli bacterium]|nr:5-bromo-4-chloroindolyl phosphate hydrolysis family protein [Bacilli bacterium]
MKNKEIVSAFVGSGFFALPYLGLSVALGPSLIIGCAAFGASELMLSGIKPKETLKNTNRSLYQKIQTAKKQNKEIFNMIPKIENSSTRNSLKDIINTVDKILEVVEQNPKKGNKIDNFFDYYLPVLLKIVNKYDEIENKNLISKEGKSFMTKADKMIKETKDAFDTILSSLYEKDLIDADAEMKVYDLMLKADGIVGEHLIMKGSDANEK